MRKHEVTHTAEHHQVHARSRAVIYKDLQMPFPTVADLKIPFTIPNGEYSAAINPSNSHNLPRGRSTEALNSYVTAHHPRRGNSISSTRSSPYERPADKFKPYVNRCESNLHLSFGSGFSSSISPIQQKLVSDFSNGPQFQFVDEFSNSSGSPSSEFRSSNQIAFPGRIRQEADSHNHESSSGYTASISTHPFERYPNELHDFRRSSQPTFLTPERPHDPSLGGIPEMYRTGSLPSNSLYPSSQPPHDGDHLNLSTLFPHTYGHDASLVDFSFLNISSQNQPNYEYSNPPDEQPHLWTSHTQQQEPPYEMMFPSPHEDPGSLQQGDGSSGIAPLLNQVTQLAGTDSSFLQYFSNPTLQANKQPGESSTAAQNGMVTPICPSIPLYYKTQHSCFVETT